MSWVMRVLIVAHLLLREGRPSISSGQIIATENTTDFPQIGGLAREMTLFQGNLGWWITILWPDLCILKVCMEGFDIMWPESISWRSQTGHRLGAISISSPPKGGASERCDSRTFTGAFRNQTWVDEKRAPGCLGCIGDYTTQLYGDFNKPI